MHRKGYSFISRKKLRQSYLPYKYLYLYGFFYQSVKNLFLFKDINKDCPNFRAALISRHLIKIDTFPMRELNSQAHKKIYKSEVLPLQHLGNGR